MAPFLLANFLATLYFVPYLCGGRSPPYTYNTKYNVARQLAQRNGARIYAKAGKANPPNSASVWLAPPEMDSPGAGVGNGVGVGAALKAALKGRFKGPFKGRNTAASADQLVVMRNYGIFGERRNFFRPPLRGAIHTEAPLGQP